MSEVLPKSVAVIGSGPAGLMAADVLAHAGVPVTIYEKRPGPGRKLFIAGSSGLNVTNCLPSSEFSTVYRGGDAYWPAFFRDFGAGQWLNFLDKSLGLETFLGTSGRYFVKTMNAGLLMRHWRRRLTTAGVAWQFQKEACNFASMQEGEIVVEFADGSHARHSAAIFALGGGSWEPDEKPLRWPQMFIQKGIPWVPLQPSNVGYRFAWKPGFLAEAEGQPLKNIVLTTSRGSRRGDLIVTAYGLEGTPIYTLGASGSVTLDLAPDLTSAQISEKLARTSENLAPIRRVQRLLNMSKASQSLLFHHAPAAALSDLAAMSETIKSLPLNALGPQSLDEAISSAGGVSWDAVDADLMLKDSPEVYVAGEMLDWDAPTGGFLIQGCVAMGHAVGKKLLAKIHK